eukprot:3337448-Pleurochrysis_carterae.AAC.2
MWSLWHPLLLAATAISCASASPLLASGPSGRSSSRQLIVGGTETSPLRYTFQVVLYKGAIQREKLLCGGSLITSRAVLTAAHCFLTDQRITENYWVGVHRWDLRLSSDDDKCSKMIRVSQVILHETFVRDSLGVFRNDVAVMLLADEAPCAPPNTEFIELDRTFSIDHWNSRLAVVIGWGATFP